MEIVNHFEPFVFFKATTNDALKKCFIIIIACFVYRHTLFFLFFFMMVQVCLFPVLTLICTACAGNIPALPAAQQGEVAAAGG